MSSIEVYNTTNNPIIYGDGKTIAGLEWVVVEENQVRAFIDEGTLRVRTKPRYAPVISPVVDQTPEPEPKTSVEDSSATESVVPSNTAEETTPAETTETVAESPVDTAATKDKPATMRKTRRRKTTPPVKE